MQTDTAKQLALGGQRCLPGSPAVSANSSILRRTLSKISQENFLSAALCDCSRVPSPLAFLCPVPSAGVHLITSLEPDEEGMR